MAGRIFKALADNEESLHKEGQTSKYLHAIEDGQTLYLPRLSFTVKSSEKELLSFKVLQKKQTSIHYFPNNQKLLGACKDPLIRRHLYEMLRRFSQFSQETISHLFPKYAPHLIQSKTCFDPLEVRGNSHIYGHRLHMDIDAKTPLKNYRKLCFFANINPFDLSRVWNIGEPYAKVIKRFLPQLKSTAYAPKNLAYKLGLSKAYRTIYDELMLKMNQRMTFDSFYQNKVDQELISFEANTCWLAFTDQLSYVPVSGQYLLSQTFFLPINAQGSPEKSPLKYMERLTHKNLIK